MNLAMPMPEGDEPGPVFVGGCPRSGMTLLGAILDAHPDISCGPDAGLIALPLGARDFTTTLSDLHATHFDLPPSRVRANFADAMARILNARRDREKKRLAVEKSAMNILVFGDLAEMFPQARFIHCIRDGRDVAASLLEQQWRDPHSGELYAHCADAGAAAGYWARLVDVGLAAEKSLPPPRIHRLRYEALVAMPQLVLRRLLHFLGLPWSNEVLFFHRRERAGRFAPLNALSVGRGRLNFGAEDLARITAAAGPALKRLGYE